MMSRALETQMKRIQNYHFELKFDEQGRVISIGDGIVWIEGLASAAIDEIIRFEEGSLAMVFHLTEASIGAILLVQSPHLSAGMRAYHFKPQLWIPVGDALLGRIIDPLGNPLDDKNVPNCHSIGLLDVLSPPILHRDFVHQPLYTGNKILDTLIPLGKGQRELFIGDNGLGKTSLALDIVLNQKNQNMRCIYVLISQNRSTVNNIIELLQQYDALDYTTVVVTEATMLPGLHYLAPFAGCAIAEYWMKQGLDTLIVYDDLTAHANSYRELSLLLRRPPGREAFPADIFHLHARLLERSTCLSPELGGGSMTALPIIETREGEIATYIPTNLISITDGQIFFDAHLFGSGFLPAIDITKSVSRIGGKAQHPLIRQEAGRMKLDYMQFLDLEVFTKFGTKLDPKMQTQIQRGRIIREILKQDRLSPLPITFQLVWLMLFNDGVLNEISLDDIPILLQKIKQKLETCILTLSHSREDWEECLVTFLEEQRHDQTNAN